MGNLKSKLFICSGLVAYLLFGQGCGDDKESDMPITIPSTEDTQPTLQKDGGSTTFSFNAPQAWSVSVRETTATRSASWLKVHPTSGAAGDVTITITAEPNVTGETRTAEVTIRSGSQTETVTVTQDYSNFITLEQREIVAGSEEQTVTLDITSTMEYEVLIPDSVDWITDGGNTRAVTTRSHTLTIAANSSYDPRQTEVVFRGKTDATLADTVKVYQAYKGAIVVAKNEYEVDAVGGALDFKVQTNLDLEVTVSADWIKQVQGRTRGLVEKDLFFDISPNESDSVGREATITIKGKDTGISQDILVRQTAYVPVLDTVIYRTGYTWEEAHDNLPLLYYAHVERERHYTNGKVYTDRFVDLGHMVGIIGICLPETGEYPMEDGIKLTVATNSQISNDSIAHTYSEMRVPYYTAISANDSEYNYGVAGEWDKYVVSKLYDENSFISAADAPADKALEHTDLPTGWYFKDIRGNKYYNVNYLGPEIYWDGGFIQYWFDYVVYDQFLVIDGRRIDFLKYRPKFHFKFFEEEVPGGIKHTYECKFNFMERNFYGAIENTIYGSAHDPNDIYYYDVHDFATDTNTAYSALQSSEEYYAFISANQQPIIKTSADWIIITDIEQIGKMENPPQILEWYKWKIKWTISSNFTSNRRKGYIYIQDKNGKKMYQKKLIQEGQ